jgi:2-polyprenyl-3-methyl-5-hydroxy-6-metoxy-1,4-benzoquinol methylase
MNKFGVALTTLRALLRPGRRPIWGLWAAENVKVLAYELARQRLEAAHRAGDPGAAASCNERALTSMVCTSSHWRSEWLPYWAGQMGLQPALHRKIWEFAFIARALDERAMLASGRSGLGFGCGNEPLASVFAARECSVLATDLPTGDVRAKNWACGQQHADSMKGIWASSLCSREVAARNLDFMPVDMNDIPTQLSSRFDFCWSACALEHLGSIENGLRFIRNSVRCLKPGGVAVHTTELNLDEGRTLDNHPTVLFHPSHFERLATELQSEGVRLSPLGRDPQDPFLDSYIDTPPYPDPGSVGATLSMLHLRLMVASFRTTSVGLILTKSG